LYGRGKTTADAHLAFGKRPGADHQSDRELCLREKGEATRQVSESFPGRYQSKSWRVNRQLHFKGGEIKRTARTR